jgi:hypothetical protein
VQGSGLSLLGALEVKGGRIASGEGIGSLCIRGHGFGGSDNIIFIAEAIVIDPGKVSTNSILATKKAGPWGTVLSALRVLVN